MALVSDAFGQQSVRYPLRKANNTATVPISQYYDRYVAGGAYSRNIDRNIEQSVTAAIYDDALIANLSATSAAINPQCSTGNCTFPTYASLAITSECIDVCTLIEGNCVNVFTGECLTKAYQPNGLFLQNEGVYKSVFAMSSTLPPNTRTFDSYQGKVAAFSVILYEVIPPTFNEGLKIHNTTKTFVYDCISLFCAQTFDAIVFQGQFSETVSQTYHMNDMGAAYSELTIPQGLIPHGSNLTFSASSGAGLALWNWMRYNMNGTGVMETTGSDRWKNDILRALSQNGASRVS